LRNEDKQSFPQWWRFIYQLLSLDATYAQVEVEGKNEEFNIDGMVLIEESSYDRKSCRDWFIGFLSKHDESILDVMLFECPHEDIREAFVDMLVFIFRKSAPKAKILPSCDSKELLNVIFERLPHVFNRYNNGPYDAYFRLLVEISDIK
jgi:hypothetical protein